MSTLSTRWTAGLAASALVAGGLSLGSAPAAPAAEGSCTTPTGTVSVFSYNDFHGRIVDGSKELAAMLFTPVEEARAAQGADNVLLLSAGDNIGGSTFVSAVANDKPTLDVIAAAGVEAVTAGNHEFDKGWADLSGRVAPDAGIPYLAANVYSKGTTTVAAPLKPYQIFDKGGVKVAVVGAVTGDLPSLVSPAGIAELSIGDPVQAINRVAKELSDGNAANGEADVVIASLHEGAGNAKQTAQQNADASANFASIYGSIDQSVDVVFNAHTHQLYNWTTKDGKTPLLQAASYASDLAKVDIAVDSASRGICSVTPSMVKPAAAPGAQPRIQKILEISRAAAAEAKELGSEVVGSASAAISTPDAGGSGSRDVESPMNNAVAQMFHDQMGKGNPEFIGIQNPGGTRTSFNKGDITYEEAALVLPFANSLMTTQLTGAQFKTVLEQQWQRSADGKVPSRPYLALGLSKNVTYTFDETRPEGDRITSVHVNGKPIDPAKRYTVGSGSFLISGGDNFHEFAKGTGAADSGLVDLTAWVDWIKGRKTLAPDYSKRGVSAAGPSTLLEGDATTFVLGKPGATHKDTLDMRLDASGELVSPRQPNTSVVATIGGTEVGRGTVTDGVANVSVKVPVGTSIPAGENSITFTAKPSGTVVRLPVTVQRFISGPILKAPYEVPGFHIVGGRHWSTRCEPYSQTIRCRTDIWSKQVVLQGGKYVIKEGWFFNNLTYLPFMTRAQWGSNPLAKAGQWTNLGRKYKTECDTAVTGKGACRSFIWGTKVQATPTAPGKYTYKLVDGWVFNNIVRFKN